MKRLIHQILTGLVLSTSLTAGAAGLSNADVANATALANSHPWTISRQSDRRSISNGLGIQTLSVEIAEQKNQTEKTLVRVYQYDHQLQKTRRLDINLNENKVTRVLTVPSTHLPLNQNEIDFAKSILAESALIDQMKNEQVQSGRVPFSSLDELHVKAIIFEPFDTTHPCYVERCALLSLFDDSMTVFSTEPVVHLSSGLVRSLGER